MTFPKEGVKLTQANFAAIGKRLEPLLAGGGSYRLILKTWRETRSLSQNNLSHAWYEQISKYLVSRGKAFASPEWVKDALKHTYLGYEQREMTDVITGEKITVSSLRHTSDLDTGDMFDYMSKVQAWAAEIGCLVSVPADSEYQQLRERQDA
ncbi:YbcN family protein [Klebsiella aerogenes]|uniref:YbcN family protein n=1 Tax=Klebsiella aerogenes TaxID=548 RepID=UPI001C22F2FB|nr:YbcN family protein [Klebsiella aerogenes]QXA73932.1 YbcN family protein [Klebsiella aerogenes]